VVLKTRTNEALKPTFRCPSRGQYYAIPAAALAGGYLYSLHTGQGDLTPLVSLTSALCCVGGIGGLSSQQTARLGNGGRMHGSIDDGDRGRRRRRT
jgi:hypothetical protein